MRFFMVCLHDGDEGVDCFRPSEMFFRRPELFLLSQVVGVEESDVFLLGKNT